MAISLDAYRMTGKISERVVVIDNAFLRQRFEAYCPVCKAVRLHEPIDGEIRHCCSCDFDHKDTDLGIVTLMGVWVRL